MYEAYSIVCLVIFVFFAVIWKTSDFLNAFIKVVMVLMTLWTTLEVLDRLDIIEAYKPINAQTACEDLKEKE